MPKSFAVAPRDANHAALTALYEAMGCTVQDTSMVGGGFPDAIVGSVGRDDKVEFKMPGEDLRANQERWLRDWRGSRPRVIRTEDDVIAHVTAMRRGAR